MPFILMQWNLKWSEEKVGVDGMEWILVLVLVLFHLRRKIDELFLLNLDKVYNLTKLLIRSLRFSFSFRNSFWETWPQAKHTMGWLNLWMLKKTNIPPLLQNLFIFKGWNLEKLVRKVVPFLGMNKTATLERNHIFHTFTLPLPLNLS